MQRKGNRNLIIYFFLIPLALLGVVLVWGLPQSCEQSLLIKPLSPEQALAYKAFANQLIKPDEFLKSVFNDYDFVFLGEYFDLTLAGFSQNVSVLKDAIAMLYQAGVRAIGLGQLYASEQELIDELMASPDFKQELIQHLLLNGSVVLGYTEYERLIREIWSFNRSLAKGLQPLRLFGLGLELDLTEINSEEDLNDNQKMQKVFKGITPEEYIAKVIEEKILPYYKKGLFYLCFEFCLKDIRYKERAKYYEKIGLAYHGSSASIIAQKYPAKIFVIFQHNLWLKDSDKTFCLPFNGLLDSFLENLPQNQRSFGFKLKDSPLVSLPINENFSDLKANKITAERICDGYLVNGALYTYELLSLPESIINQKSIGRIRKQLGLTPEIEQKIGYPEIARRLNQRIADINKQMRQIIH